MDVTRRAAFACLVGGFLFVQAGPAAKLLLADADTKDPVVARAEAIAADLADFPEFYGFGIETLISILIALLPGLLKCLFPNPEPPTPQELKEFADDAWNERRQEYDARTIRRGKVQAKKQAKAKGELLTDTQARRMVVISLDHARLGRPADLQLFGVAAWKSGVPAAKED